MIPQLTNEYQEQYERIAKIGKKEFPNGSWFIETILWDDDTWHIKAEHNRTTRKSQWTCKIVIGSEESTYPSEPNQTVEYRERNADAKEITWCETKNIYGHANKNEN